MEQESDNLAWDAYEYHWSPKAADWYWSLGIVAISLAVLFIFFNNILFAIFILVGAFAAGLYAGREPALARFEIQPRGIVSKKYLYDYDSLESFWVEESPRPQIIVKSKKFLMPYIIIPISHVPPDEVRDHLVRYLPEAEHHESIFHRAFEYFGF